MVEERHSKDSLKITPEGVKQPSLGSLSRSRKAKHGLLWSHHTRQARPCAHNERTECSGGISSLQPPLLGRMAPSDAGTLILEPVNMSATQQRDFADVSWALNYGQHTGLLRWAHLTKPFKSRELSLAGDRRDEAQGRSERFKV